MVASRTLLYAFVLWLPAQNDAAGAQPPRVNVRYEPSPHAEPPPRRPIFIFTVCTRLRYFCIHFTAHLIQQNTMASSEGLQTRNNNIESPKLLAFMAKQAYEQHTRTGEFNLINVAVAMAAQSIKYTPADSNSLPVLLSMYQTMLATRYRRKGDIADLEAAIQAVQQAISLIPDNHPNRGGELDSLGVLLARRYERTSKIADLNAAIQAAQRAINSTPDNGDRAGRLNNLGIHLNRRYERTADIADLEGAIQAAQQAINSTPDNHPARVGYLENLGNHLLRRYERTGDIVDLDTAIKAGQQAINSTPDNDPDQAGYLNNLGMRLICRYEQTGNIADLDAAIQAAQQAVDLTPKNHADRAPMLNNLGTKLERRYRRTGDLLDLEAAIQAAQGAIDSTPDNHLHQARILNNLGNNLESRYERTGNIADLEAAIQAAQQAVNLTSTNHPDRALVLNCLGIHLFRRHERTGDMTNLEAAIQAAQEALNLTPNNHPDRADYLNNFGSKLKSQYEQTSDLANLEVAIRVTQQAVNLVPNNHPARPGYLGNLGVYLIRKYERTSNIADLEAAIQAVQQAVDLTPNDHPDRAGYLDNLGHILIQRYDRKRDAADLEKCGDLFLGAWKCETGIPFRRVQAAARCVEVLGMRGKLGPAAALADEAMNMMPTISNRSFPLSDQQYVISYFYGLPASACSVYLRLGLHEEALEILERGRTVILSQLMSDRSDLSALSEAHPEKARCFQKLLDEINAPFSRQDDPGTMKNAQQWRRDRVAAFERCVNDIRNIPGYDRFFLGLTPAEMRTCATEGLIVVVNVTIIASHAIIVSSSEIKSIELPKLSTSGAQRWPISQTAGVRENQPSINKELREYLDWLYQVCVKDVLVACGLQVQQDKRALPRIWWIGTGLASSMPFHAAGDHRPRSDKNLFKRVLSSYTPSIKALAYSRQRPQKSDVYGDSVLLATMTASPGQADLGGVEGEKEAILEVLPAHFKSDIQDSPSASQVMQSLKHCNIAHFACHGLTNSRNPSESGLVFQKQDRTGQLIQDTVTVRNVSELKLEHARLAYLSACSTAENRARRLGDEVIHVVSGFQVAGFAHVVGCLWPSADAVCVEVTKAFYGTLFGGDRNIDDKDIALALHEAVSAARMKEWDQPLKWAPYVQYGA